MKWKDPVVEEVHEIRRQMMREFGNDFHKLCAHLRAKEEEHSGQYVTEEELRAKRLVVAEAPADYGKVDHEVGGDGAETAAPAS
jgi:hypothetical protein